MAYIGRPLNAANLAVQSGTGDGSDTTPIATLNYATTTNGIAVYLDGVRQLAGTDYNVTAQTTLTFTTAPANGVGVDVYFLGLEVSIPTPADSSISTAKIVDNSVTLAKMAGGTDGQVITYDASGDPVAVGPGTDGQVLTSTGAGSPPAFEDAGGGGAWTFIATAVASSSSSIDFTSGLTSTYQQYAIVCSSVVCGGGGVTMQFTVSDDGGSSYESSNYSFHLSKGSSASSAEAYTGLNSIGYIRMHEDLASSAGTNWTGVVYLNDPANASIFTQVHWSGVSARSTSEYTRCDTGAGTWNVTTAVNAIRFAPSGGTITSGRFTLYGIAHA